MRSLILISFAGSLICHAPVLASTGGETAPRQGFDEKEPLLYPGGFPTSDSLRDEEWLFAPQGWMSYGLNGRTTLMVDWLVTIFGIPAGYLRHQLPFKGKTTHALEVYGVRFGDKIKGEDIYDFDDEIIIEQRGWQAWLHWNTTTRLGNRWRWHNFAGFTYDTYQRYAPEAEPSFTEKVHTNYFSPDVGTALEWTVGPRLKLHANFIYGNTLYFFDQNTYKYLAVYTIHTAPFPRDWWPVFSRVRLEFNALFGGIPGANYHFAVPVPYYMVFLWQWGGKS